MEWMDDGMVFVCPNDPSHDEFVVEAETREIVLLNRENEYQDVLELVSMGWNDDEVQCRECGVRALQRETEVKACA